MRDAWQMLHLFRRAGIVFLRRAYVNLTLLILEHVEQLCILLAIFLRSFIRAHNVGQVRIIRGSQNLLFRFAILFAFKWDLLVCSVLGCDGHRAGG